MNPVFADLLAAVALAFGTTAFTTFSVRTDDSPRLVVATFLWSVPAIFMIFDVVNLPAALTLQLAFGGLGIGLVSCAGLLLAHFIERHMEDRDGPGHGQGAPRVYDLTARRHMARRRPSPLRDRPV